MRGRGRPPRSAQRAGPTRPRTDAAQRHAGQATPPTTPPHLRHEPLPHPCAGRGQGRRAASGRSVFWRSQASAAPRKNAQAAPLTPPAAGVRSPRAGMGRQLRMPLCRPAPKPAHGRRRLAQGQAHARAAATPARPERRRHGMNGAGRAGVGRPRRPQSGVAAAGTPRLARSRQAAPRWPVGPGGTLALMQGRRAAARRAWCGVVRQPTPHAAAATAPRWTQARPQRGRGCGRRGGSEPPTGLARPRRPRPACGRRNAGGRVPRTRPRMRTRPHAFGWSPRPSPLRVVASRHRAGLNRTTVLFNAQRRGFVGGLPTSSDGRPPRQRRALTAAPPLSDKAALSDGGGAAHHPAVLSVALREPARCRGPARWRPPGSRG